MIRKIFGKLKAIVSNRKYRKILKSNSTSDTVYVDLGSTSIKMAYKGDLISFKSSVREIKDINEITPATTNYIKVGTEYYIIGEAEKSNEVCEYKVDRNYIEIMILYGLKVFKDKGIEVSNNLKVNVLLPYDEVKFKSKLEKKVNGLYKVDDTEVTLTVKQLFVEGESSSTFYKEHYKAKGNIIVINIGGKTTDAILINSQGHREKIVSIDLATQYLLSQVVRYTKAPTSNILSTWLVDGYTFTKEEKEHVRRAGKEFVSNIWNDLFAGVIKIANPSNTTILLVGGGSNILKDSIQEAIPNGYKVKTLSSYENIYADLLGAMILGNEEVSIPVQDTQVIKEVKEVESIEFNIPVESIKEVKAITQKVPAKKKGKYADFVLMKEKGMEQQQIIENLGIALQTYRNMNCRYNKEKNLNVA